MTAPEEHVHIGDIWRENDIRFVRYVKVLMVSDTHAVIQTVANRLGEELIQPPRPTKAKLSRFGKGYVRP